MCRRCVGTIALVTAAAGGLIAVLAGASVATAQGWRLAAAGVTHGTAKSPPAALPLCHLAAGAKKLPPMTRHGLIDHLEQYPAVHLAKPKQRARARRVLEQLMSAAKEGDWRDLAAVARAGYDARTVRRKRGDRSVHYLHAERHQEPRTGGILNARRPKALIFANAPGRPLVLVGAMWSMRPGERGPTPAGPILRWHSHMVCARGNLRGIQPTAAGKCPAGTQLRQGRSEMLHVWFTRELRSAFAIRAPEPELCSARLLPHGYCRRL